MAEETKAASHSQHRDKHCQIGRDTFGTGSRGFGFGLTVRERVSETRTAQPNRHTIQVARSTGKGLGGQGGWGKGQGARHAGLTHRNIGRQTYRNTEGGKKDWKIDRETQTGVKGNKGRG